jgi:hypothetical protein
MRVPIAKVGGASTKPGWGFNRLRCSAAHLSGGMMVFVDLNKSAYIG